MTVWKNPGTTLSKVKNTIAAQELKFTNLSSWADIYQKQNSDKSTGLSSRVSKPLGMPSKEHVIMLPARRWGNANEQTGWRVRGNGAQFGFERWRAGRNTRKNASVGDSSSFLSMSIYATEGGSQHWWPESHSYLPQRQLSQMHIIGYPKPKGDPLKKDLRCFWKSNNKINLA